MSKSWQSTIRLPKASFPARPSPQRHDHYLQQCTDHLYAWQRAHRVSNDTNPPFLLHDGPPYANGSLHVGHALNKILKDIILRVHLQRGRRVAYTPGWDCHGLPIELKALEAASSSSTSMTPVEVRASARALASRTVLAQMAEFRSYGVMADWDARWTTMDAAFELRQLELFLRMVRRGLVQRRFKPVYWSPSSGTALAEAELEYKEDHTSQAAYVKFPVEEMGAVEQGKRRRVYAVIWTTTPWTLPANRAIAVHDELDYVLLKHGDDEALLVGKDCLAQVCKVCLNLTPDSENENEQPEILASYKGSDLRRFTYRNPLHGAASPQQPIIHADFVSADSGSGLVHLAPGHGHDDYEACRALGLEISAPVDDRGHFTADAYPQDPPRLAGLFAQGKGNATVLGLLGEQQMLLHTHKYKHKYPYDWRTKKPIMVRATAQWFADVGEIKEAALAALGDVEFIPATGRTRLESFVRGRSEWCISRQRAWGVPIPALYDSVTGEAVMTEESVRHIIGVIRERGTDAWWSDDPADLAWIPASLLQGQDGVQYRRGTDTMDVWFDSGSSWTFEGGARADVFLEGSDQHRGWFQSSLLTRVAAAAAASESSGSLIDQPVGLAPFKRLITHGFTLDKNGKKMSKSLGNTLTPNQVMDGSLLPPIKPKKTQDAPAPSSPGPHYDALGPDALRLWAASSDYTHDVVIGAPVLKSIHSSLIKYRTITKMLLGSMLPSARTSRLTHTDHIAMLQLRDTMAEVARAYDAYEFYKGFAALNRWVNADLSALYLEASKDRLYCGDGGGVLEAVFVGFMRMLAPITPLLVEEAWDHAPAWLKEEEEEEEGNGGAMMQRHPLRQLYDAPLPVDEARLPGNEAELRAAISVLAAVHAGIKAATERARREKVMGSSLACAIVLEVADAGVAGVLQGKMGPELADLFVVSSVEVNGVVPEAPEWKFELDCAVPSCDNNNDEAVEVPCKVWVLPPKAHKCPRCWRYVAPKEDELCGRCEDVVGR